MVVGAAGSLIAWHKLENKTVACFFMNCLVCFFKSPSLSEPHHIHSIGLIRFFLLLPHHTITCANSVVVFLCLCWSPLRLCWARLLAWGGLGWWSRAVCWPPSSELLPAINHCRSGERGSPSVAS